MYVKFPTFNVKIMVLVTEVWERSNFDKNGHVS